MKKPTGTKAGRHAVFSLGLCLWATKPNLQPQCHTLYMLYMPSDPYLPGSHKSHHAARACTFALHYQDEGRSRDARTFQKFRRSGVPACWRELSPNCWAQVQSDFQAFSFISFHCSVHPADTLGLLINLTHSQKVSKNYLRDKVSF